MYKDSEDNDLINSVIVETISLVVPKPTKTLNVFQENNSHLKNFKKFKRVKFYNNINKMYQIKGIKTLSY